MAIVSNTINFAIVGLMNNLNHRIINNLDHMVTNYCIIKYIAIHIIAHLLLNIILIDIDFTFMDKMQIEDYAIGEIAITRNLINNVIIVIIRVDNINYYLNIVTTSCINYFIIDNFYTLGYNITAINLDFFS